MQNKAVEAVEISARGIVLDHLSTKSLYKILIHVSFEMCIHVLFLKF